ncbi:HET-domain-containing protein [Lophiostoma macrostomum CBS 122681]|uniref:HET-domain-containing protein n=1 Tax=Lophiostoma macrostomum CBS 122681 TaxID=1314788 RepID=A0A6A6SLS6_9PLEO|nr:HET-domain-containing protein [Lophiostoma macrostomum CBS 122681]
MDRKSSWGNTLHIMIGGTIYKAFSLLSIYADPETPASEYLPSRPINRNPVQGMQTIRNWLRDCDENHSCVSMDLPRLPTRVLDVSAVPTVLTTHGERARYVTLSYCWGTSGKNLLLTEDTLEPFSTKGIESSQMPKTILDAITIVRELGLKYIWIDALCIIQQQQDRKDVKAEAPNMAEYYQNAYITLSAARAADCSEGFLDDRPLPLATPCAVAYSLYRGPEDTGQGAETIAYLSLPEALYASDRDPVNTRAWTFQESELSRRLLSFGETQFKFLCQELRQHENGERMHRAQRASLSKVLSSSNGMYTGTERDILRLWYQYVEDYSGRGMTDPEDKFAALAGVAKSFQDVLKCKYMFGLWENDLITGLLWRTHRTGPDQSGNYERWPHRAPSWSWGSIDGWFDATSSEREEASIGDSGIPRSHVLSHEGIGNFLDPIREDLMLPKAFELHLEGILRKAKAVSWSHFSDELLGTHTHFLVDTSLLDNSSTSAGVYVGRGTYDIASDEVVTELEMLRFTWDRGLMLERVGDKWYRRLGCFEVANNREGWYEDGRLQSIILI